MAITKKLAGKLMPLRKDTHSSADFCPRTETAAPVLFKGPCDRYRLIEYLTRFVPDPSQLFPPLEFSHQLVYLEVAFFWGVLLQVLSS